MQSNNSSILSEPKSPLDLMKVKEAYRRQASFYDIGFGVISGVARKKTIQAINHSPGIKILEVGVGTGLALPYYTRDKQVVGIDLSKEMLIKAREKRARNRLSHVKALVEMDAQNMSFEDDSFDSAVAMFVASVVPDPRKLLAEMRRVVRPGGQIFLVNHFARQSGPIARIENIMAKSSSVLGWHPDFKVDFLLTKEEQSKATMKELWPLGLFTLVNTQ